MNITVDELRQLIITCAGAPDIAVADGDFADTSFEELGYESLALMESAALIERDYGVRIADDVLFATKTPRELAELIRSEQEAMA
jgi:act minimal PKS acyl carrier protein